jgi:hypothetical protein
MISHDVDELIMWMNVLYGNVCFLRKQEYVPYSFKGNTLKFQTK